MCLVLQTATKVFALVQQAHPVKKGIKTMQGTSSTKSMGIARNWLNISEN